MCSLIYVNYTSKKLFSQKKTQDLKLRKYPHVICKMHIKRNINESKKRDVTSEIYINIEFFI